MCERERVREIVLSFICGACFYCRVCAYNMSYGIIVVNFCSVSVHVIFDT